MKAHKSHTIPFFYGVSEPYRDSILEMEMNENYHLTKNNFIY